MLGMFEPEFVLLLLTESRDNGVPLCLVKLTERFGMAFLANMRLDLGRAEDEEEAVEVELLEDKGLFSKSKLLESC